MTVTNDPKKFLGEVYTKTPTTYTVYRIEDPRTGYGPYNDRDSGYPLWDKGRDLAYAHQGYSHPSPGMFNEWYHKPTGVRDAWAFSGKDYGARRVSISAFDSLQALNNWFKPNGWLRQIRKAGFVVRKYVVPASNIMLSPKQALFHRGSELSVQDVSWCEVVKSRRSEH